MRDVNPQRVLDAALELIDADGLAALSMRKLAAELGVQAPSLYHHVAGKAELLASLVEQVGTGADASWFGERSWDQALLRWGRTYHAALAAHPALAPLFVNSPGSSDSALRRIDRVHGGLVDAGWTPREATEIAAAVKFLVMGAASGSVTAGFPADPQLYAGRYPHLSSAHRLAGHRGRVDADTVELALVALVDGLRLRLSRAPGV
ncbi:MAG: TetR family transcriptional regulator [Mycobacteriaceae bacterium]